MKALITGGGGFLGRSIVRVLQERGWDLRILGRQPQPDLDASGVEVMRGDLAELDSVCRATRGVEAVFHVAAQAGIWGAWEHYYKPNVLGTRNLLTCCRESGVRDLVYTSTPSVVFNRQPFRGDNETLPYGGNWLCHYAHTKAIAEKEVLEAHDPDGLRTTALRPHLIWGPGDPHLVPRIIERVRAGKLRVVGDGTNRVDITHVRNAALAHGQALLALRGGVAGGKAYFISQGEPVLLWDWINDLLRRMDLPPVQKEVSLATAYRGGAVMESIWKWLHLRGEPPMTRFVAMELGKDHWFDIRAARRDLDYQPEISTEEGLEETAAWARHNLLSKG